jgi:hypothetical protein
VHCHVLCSERRVLSVQATLFCLQLVHHPTIRPPGSRSYIRHEQDAPRRCPSW